VFLQGTKAAQSDASIPGHSHPSSCQPTDLARRSNAIPHGPHTVRSWSSLARFGGGGIFPTGGALELCQLCHASDGVA